MGLLSLPCLEMPEVEPEPFNMKSRGLSAVFAFTAWSAGVNSPSVQKPSFLSARVISSVLLSKRLP